MSGSTRTLAVILHYNTTECTDALYRQLKPFEQQDYDLIVLDNGSEPGRLSRYAIHRIEPNRYFGGGLNAAFKMVLECPRYDSLLFLNSDLQLHGRDFVRTLRRYLLADDDLMILSPAVIQSGEQQSPWRMMHNWYADDVRFVEWADFQAPLMKRRFIEDVRCFDDELMYGWGQDILSGILCKEKHHKIGVLDKVTIVHAGSYTIAREHPGYHDKAMAGMLGYFRRTGRLDELNRMRRYAADYAWSR